MEDNNRDGASTDKDKDSGDSIAAKEEVPSSGKGSGGTASDRTAYKVPSFEDDTPTAVSSPLTAVDADVFGIANDAMAFGKESHEGEVSQAVTNREDGHTIQVLPSFGSLAITCRLWSNSCLML